jgi:argininosuccinate lyase
MKLWGGRFSGRSDPSFEAFNASFPFDKRLLAADVEGSRGYAQALVGAGILTEQEAGEIRSALDEILRFASQDSSYLAAAHSEDVHSFVESEIVRLIGETGYKLHTGRSRNDQVATDLRIFLRNEIDRVVALICKLQEAILDLADENRDVVMPGYTHMQRAQPVLFAHYALAYYEMFKRDGLRLAEIRSRVSRLPLGSGALAGTGFNIDREALARNLGFEGVCANSLDAVSDRDFVIEFAGAASIAMMHLSRLAEDLILYATAEFGFVELSDAVSTGSSLMPQKKNPDSLELIRGKAGRVFGHHIGLLATMKGLPLAYNKDMQEDKEPLFDAVDTLSGSITVMTTVLRNIRLNGDRMAVAAAGDCANATDLADYLVRKGLPFRRAHELVGRIVSHAIAQSNRLEDLSLGEYKQFSPLFEQDLYDSISIQASLANRRALGGTAPDRVLEALAWARQELAGEK